jgi:hypothetical protein
MKLGLTMAFDVRVEKKSSIANDEDSLKRQKARLVI